MTRKSKTISLTRRKVAMSVAERVAKHVAAKNEIGELPPVRHKRVRDRCKQSLVTFGVMYFGNSSLLRHSPSERMTKIYIDKLQDVILHGGQFAVEFPRGIGKTTWMIIAIVWSILYGHRRFAVVVAASGNLAKKIVKNIKRVIMSVEPLRADFPAAIEPFRRVEMISQKAAAQRYKGSPTNIECGIDTLKFADLRNSDGSRVDCACGATIIAVGRGASIKGQNEMGERPDIVLLDDPQTRKDAMSPRTIEQIDEYIHSDILGLGGHDAPPISCLVSITPILQGDLASRLVNKALHPEWIVSVQKMVISWPDDHERLVAEYLDAYRADCAVQDTGMSTSRTYYKNHINEFDGMEVLDPLAYNADTEYDSRHHVLNLIGKMGLKNFRAEYQMSVEPVDGERQLDEDTVARALNGLRRGSLPPGAIGAVAFADVNTREGANISWVVVGFCKRRVACVIDYGRYPQYGALVAPNASPTERDQIIARAIGDIVSRFSNQRYTRPGLPAVAVNALCFDRGWAAAVVTRTLDVLRRTKPLPFALLCSIGRGWSNFAHKERTVKRWGDHIVARESQLGDYLEIHADYWREISQGGFFAAPMSPGSTSLWGKESTLHLASQFCAEISAEKLVMRYIDNATKKEAWKYNHADHNHWGDALSGAMAIGSWFGFYDATQTTVADALGRGNDANTVRSQLPATFQPRRMTRRHNSFFKSGFW